MGGLIGLGDLRKGRGGGTLWERDKRKQERGTKSGNFEGSFIAPRIKEGKTTLRQGRTMTWRIGEVFEKHNLAGSIKDYKKLYEEAR